MQDWTASLKAIQDKDLRVARLQAQVNAVPTEKTKAKATLAEAENAVSSAKKALLDVEKSIKMLEIEVESIEAKRRDFESKSLMIKDNTEYKAAMHQIETCREQVRKLEDEELALMEQLETARSRLDAEKKRFEAVQKRTNQLLEDLDRRLNACQAQKQKLESDRGTLLNEVPRDISRMYERLLASRRHAGREPIGFAPIEDSSCSCCHMNIPPQIRVNALKGQKVNCPQCSVLLYVDD
jgi:predicted  nucleic acid-binding Zn-ribbon protein